jgi:hypothetical protein
MYRKTNTIEKQVKDLDENTCLTAAENLFFYFFTFRQHRKLALQSP